MACILFLSCVCCLVRNIFFGDEAFEVSHVFGANVDAGYEVGSEEVGEDVAVDVVGFYFCFGDASGFEGVDKGYL